jgi:hypothetical protein
VSNDSYYYYRSNRRAEDFEKLSDLDALRELLRTCRARGGKNAKPDAQARWGRYSRALADAIYALFGVDCRKRS